MNIEIETILEQREYCRRMMEVFNGKDTGMFLEYYGGYKNLTNVLVNLGYEVE